MMPEATSSTMLQTLNVSKGIIPNATMKKILPLLAGLFVTAGQGATVTFVTTADTWRYAKGTAEASSPIDAWRTRTFNDAAFVNAPAPFWYGDVLPGGTQLTDMVNNYSCIFLRKQFVVTNVNQFGQFQIGAAIDDGFVAWINGVEVLRVGMPGGAGTAVTISTLANNQPVEPPPFTTYALPAPSGYLVNGTNQLAVQVFNTTLASSDLGFDMNLLGTLDVDPPTIVNRSPASGSVVQQLNSIQVAFSEPVSGVDAGDLLVNGLPATNVTAVPPSTYNWEFATPPTGAVTIAFAPGHGIQDLASPPNAFDGDTWNYTLNTNIVLPQFFITEFMAANSGHGINGLRDEDGDGSDWIEIYNSQQTVGNIGGWFLTDVATNQTKWRIPNGVTIPGRGYLVVFASGKNRTNVLGKLHTNFQLTSGGEYLGLSDPQTNVISEFSPTFPAQQTDISYGRDRVDLNVIGFYPTPTPGSNNVTSGFGFGGEVQFSRAGGTFADPFNLTLTTTDSNSVIRYTIVSTAQDFLTATNIPTASSTLYTGPIPINTTVQVRARAFPTNAGYFPGPPHTESYVRLGAGATNFVSTLPIVVIHTLAPATISAGNSLTVFDNSVIVECFDNDGGTSSLTKTPQLVTRAGINFRGSSTQQGTSFPKGSFAVELWDEFNEDQAESFLGLPKESDWVLYAPNQFDIPLMHNPLMHQFARDMGHYSSRTRFVEVIFRNGSGAVTINTNGTVAAMGDYHGVYVLEEKVKRDNNRVDIDKLEPEHTNSTTITGGYLVKIDRTDVNERTFAGGGHTINYQDPDGLEMVTPIRAAQAAYIKSVFDNMNTGLIGNALTNIASTNHYSNHIDVDATIDLNIVNVLVMNVDGYRLSGYIYKPRNGKLVFGPVWDTDRGLGTSRGDQRSFNPRAWQSYDASGCGGTDYGTDFFAGTTPPAWLGRWFADVDFWQRWVDRYQNFRATVLDTNRVAAIVDAFGQEVREAQPRESRRWGGQSGSNTDPRTGPTANCTGIFTHNFPGTYQGEVDFQKRWLLEHINFMDTNLLNRPALNTAEGQVPLGSIVTLTDTSGKVGGSIYYTLDGSDPRGFQGTTNPAAIRYTQPITITNNVRIRARAVNANHRNMTGVVNGGSHNPVVSTPWSGDIASTYFITPPPLVITELMYHPENSADPEQDPDDFEYIELKNVGSNTLNLGGFKFTNGIDFTFTATNPVTTLAAGDYVLLVKNVAAFTSRYGVKTNIAGQYNGTLDNAGERLTLVGPRLEPILDFVYLDEWYPLSDGFGFALVIKDPNAPLNTWDNRSSWRISSAENGSPGIVDPPAPNLPVILINEALTHTDFPVVDVIELYNPGTNDVNIGGWYLTDDPTRPKKYQIPANTVITAGAYALFDESQFNTGLNGFSLESDGDEVYLFSALGGLLSGYAHGFSYGAAQNGVTFGRYVNSQGEEHFVAQSASTLGATNSLPRVGPIVISEIMYHPPDTLFGSNRVDNSVDEFIELYNIAGTNVVLFDSANPSNTWKLTQAVTFDFPTNSSMAAGSFALVVNFNPQTNATQVAAFRAKYGVAPGVPLYGPYAGKLDNSSESIRLRRPDSPNTNGVPYIIVDQINYAADGAWSKAADGAGASLQRRVLAAYGNDPTNWTAARPTAGANYSGGPLPGITQQPSNTVAFAQGTANFSIVVTGTAVSVQWRFNGDPIPGATNTTLTLAGVQYGQAGLYDVVAFNAGGAVFSSTAQLNVLAPLTFSIQPASQTVLPGTNVTITAAAFGSGPIRYQWYYEGTNGIESLVPNATNASFSFNNASLSFGHGTWRVVAMDDFSTLSSSNASVLVLIRPGYLEDLVPVTVAQGQTAVFSVMVTGAPPIWYRWIRGGSPYITSSVPILVLTNVQASTSIRVASTNIASGPGGVNSRTVQLTVHPDFDGDGVGDPWEAQYGFNTNSLADGDLDFDGDGMSNRDEYRAGTDPTDPLSVLKLARSLNGTLLQFVAQSNLSYSVQYRTNLTDAPWTSVTNVGGQINTVRTVQVSAPNPPPEQMRFYRVVTPLVP